MNYDPELKLSPHFKYKELIFSDTALKLGLDNNVPKDRPDIIERAKYIATNLLEPLRSIYGPFSPNSWYRGPDLEFAITMHDGFKRFVTKTADSSIKIPCLEILSKCQSLHALERQAQLDIISDRLLDMWKVYFSKKQHPQGEAVDIKIHAARSVQSLYMQCKALNIPYDQIILEMHKPAIPMSGWVHYSMVNESLPENIKISRTNRKMDFAIS